MAALSDGRVVSVGQELLLTGDERIREYYQFILPAED
jgi:hypothetical protein